MISIQSLTYFAKVCETRSLSRAAEQLYITQPALSMAIKSLEDELGVQLFQRSNRGMVATEAGEQLLRHSEILMRQLELIGNLSEQTRADRLSVSSFPALLRASILSEFRRLPGFEDTPVEYREGRVAQILEQVDQGVSEIGIFYYNDRQITALRRRLQNRCLELETLYTRTWGVAVGPHSPLYGCESVEIRQLLPFRHIRRENDYFSSLLENVRVGGIMLQDLRFDIVENAAMENCLLRDTDVYCFHFYGQEPCSVWRDYGVRLLPIRDAELEVSLAYVTRKNRKLSREASAFLELVKKA